MPREKEPINIGKGNLTPKPMMTPRVAPQVSQAFAHGGLQTWDNEAYIAELRAEFTHKLKTAGKMCDPQMYLHCSNKLPSSPVCDWRGYLSCSKKTLEWRKADIAAAVGKMATLEECEQITVLCDTAIRAIDKELKKSALIYTIH